MKRRLCLCLGLLSGPGLVAALSTSTAPAYAQSVVKAAPGLPMSIKSAASAVPFQSQIKTYVQTQIADIVSDDVAAQHAAKVSLINECTAGSTQSYFDAYGTEVNNAVVAAMAKKLSLRQKLNLAVVVENAARVGHTAAVKPAVILFLGDKGAPVALWGAKAAKPVIETMVQSPALLAGDTLLPALPASVASHAKSGDVAESVYLALNLSIAGLNNKQLAPLAPPLITPMLNVLQFRVGLYSTSVPDAPDAEGTVARFLFEHYAHEMTAAEQRRTVQLFSDLIASAGAQIGSASKADQSQIILTLQRVAGALTAITDPNAAVAASLAGLVRLGPGTTPSTIGGRTKGVYPALLSFMPGLTPPPVVTPAPPATGPSRS